MKRLGMTAVSALLLFALAGCGDMILEGKTYSRTIGGATITAVFSGGDLTITGPAKSDKRPYTYDDYFKTVEPALGGDRHGHILDNEKIFAFRSIWARSYFNPHSGPGDSDYVEYENDTVLYLYLEE